MASQIVLQLPEWFAEAVADQPTMPDIEQRMGFVLALAERNITEDTGGPFAAAVFTESGDLIAAGVNVVVPAAVPIAHAEIVAIANAGQTLGDWDLASVGGFELVSTTEPCAMCLGAVPWSGVRRLVCGARDEDARTVGFDEGHKPADWISNLTDSGIEVVRDVRRSAAAAVLSRYATEGGRIYNGARDA